MSRGPGRVQRGIFALVAANPDSAWSVSQLCKHIYRIQSVEPKHRVSVIRALRTMHLPGSWSVQSSHKLSGSELYLFNAASVESMLRLKYLVHPWPSDFDEWKRKHPYQLAAARKLIEIQSLGSDERE